jgi:polyphosphate kinase 2 (PPK2 family)
VLKFHLRISREEQRRRLLARLDDPAKRWKFSMADVDSRELWADYMDAYEDAIRNTANAEAPWYIVPSDQKWFAWLMVAAVIGQAMERLDLAFPEVKGKALTELEQVRAALAAGK